ncbi:sugar transferase [Fulvivirga ligni]|uniref:sugar transferase n=1 Tax=Fulvivirga ligni TaxID=2904246 RepID=UPI001F1A74DA|nr:sugar transferase [Fulvivirga ligni]UII23888.1 sugar transferase [Fulvivirga ligni]
MYKNFIKRIADFGVSFLGFLVILPVFLFVTILLAVANKGSAFFTQPRPGYKGRIFKVIKFKTMTDERDEHGELLPDEKRLTKIGSFVRKTSLDEIPQLLNVIKGDMSFVGPRPLLVEYLELYNEEQAKRHHVRPGITGWAQVNGRNAISWEEKFNFDVWYVKHQSFLLDIKILLLTVKKVFIADGISAEGVATMPKFKGTK